MNTEVIHNEDLKRYELLLEGEKIGHADYKVVDGVLEFNHTEVDPAHQGKNLAAILTRESLDDVRARGLKMRPVCPYVVKFVERYDEYSDLLG